MPRASENALKNDEHEAALALVNVKKDERADKKTFKLHIRDLHLSLVSEGDESTDTEESTETSEDDDQEESVPEAESEDTEDEPEAPDAVEKREQELFLRYMRESPELWQELMDSVDNGGERSMRVLCDSRQKAVVLASVFNTVLNSQFILFMTFRVGLGLLLYICVKPQ